MSATIKEIAEDVGVTKMAIIGRMKRIPGFYNKYTRKDARRHNMVIINDEGVHKLKSLTYNSQYGHKSGPSSENGGSKSESDNDPNVLKAKLYDYKQMLSDKQDDLVYARGQIKQLNNQVENAQNLELMSKRDEQKKSKSYEARISSLNNQIKELPSHSSNSDEKPKKKSFWQRLFGNN